MIYLYSTKSAGINGYAFSGTNCVADFVAKFINSTDDPKKKTFTKVVNFFRARRQNPAKTEKNFADLADNVANLADKVADLVDNVKFPNS